MNRARKIAVAVSLAVLLSSIVGSYMTEGAMEYLPFLHKQNASGLGAAGSHDLVDQSPWKTAETLAGLAASTEEREYAREAQRLADHEVDQSFAQALREATAEPRVLTGDALALQQRVKELERIVKQDEAIVAGLTPANPGPAPAAGESAPVSDDLAIAKAQLGLDQDELEAANEELSRKSGDPRTRIQQELANHESSMKAYDARSTGSDDQNAVVSATRYQTLAGQLSAWLAQRSRRRLLAQAEQQARNDSAALNKDNARLHALANTSASDSAVAKAAGESGSTRVKDLQRMAAQQNMLNIVADRMATLQQLTSVYAAWGAQVELQHKIVLHLMLQSLILIATILLLTILTGWLLQTALHNWSRDPRQKQTLETVLNLATQFVGLVLVLLVIFGAPRQAPTILGLATAGLTVVFQDFILAFCGWFVLMGKHGIRVGDWVEIDGVGGEVVTVGVFRTWLLETGNWTANGHPTGRRVSFLNGFAIKSKYFNFSTAGQWMWDEIKVSIPPGAQTYSLIEKIREATLKVTEHDARMAEQEWKRVTHEEGLPHFSATPSVSMRPAGAGIDIVVRYVTRAGVRLETRNRLFRIVVELMLGPSQAISDVATEPDQASLPARPIE